MEIHTSIRMTHALLVALTLLAVGGVELPADETSEPNIDELVGQLGDKSFAKRQEATRRLGEIGEPALAALRKALKASQDNEVRTRAKGLIAQIQKTLYSLARQYGPHRGVPIPWSQRVVTTPDGKLMVSSGLDTLRVWEVATGRQVRQLGAVREGHWSLATSADSSKLIAGGNDSIVRIWNLKTGLLEHEFKGHAESVWGVTFTRDGKRAISGAWDGTIRTWDLDKGKSLSVIAAGSKVRCVALSPKEDRLVTAHFTKEGAPAHITIWDARTGKKQRTMNGHTDVVTSVEFSPDGGRVLSASFDRSIRLWDAATGKQVRQFTGHSSRVECAAFSTDGRRVVSCAEAPDATFRVWDTESAEQIWSSDKQRAGFLSIAVLHDGQHYATSGKDGFVRLWRAKGKTSD